MNLARVAQRSIWACLALVLLFAPLLGLMHGVVHGTGAAPHAAHVHEAGDHTHEHTQGDGWLADLFSVHAEDADCRVYDQLCHSDGLAPLPLLALPMALTPFSFLCLQGEVLARRAALFEARGPPPAR